jgi:hypothetical protein
VVTDIASLLSRYICLIESINSEFNSIYSSTPKLREISVVVKLSLFINIKELPIPEVYPLLEELENSNMGFKDILSFNAWDEKTSSKALVRDAVL